MNKNNLVKKNLEAQFEFLKSYFEINTFEEFVHKQIKLLTTSTGSPYMDSYNQDDCKKLIKITQQFNLIERFDLLFQKTLNLPEIELEKNLRENITQSIKAASKKIKKTNPYRLGILFIEYDLNFRGSLGGFGEGKTKYPILNNPQYFDYNYQEELFNGVGKIDFQFGLEYFKQFENELKRGVLHFLQELNGEYYHKLKKLNLSKQFLIIHEIFNDSEVINNLKTQIPTTNTIYIYGNEHDCEFLNISIIEK